MKRKLMLLKLWFLVWTSNTNHPKHRKTSVGSFSFPFFVVVAALRFSRTQFLLFLSSLEKNNPITVSSYFVLGFNGFPTSTLQLRP